MQYHCHVVHDDGRQHHRIRRRNREENRVSDLRLATQIGGLRPCREPAPGPRGLFRGRARRVGGAARRIEELPQSNNVRSGPPTKGVQDRAVAPGEGVETIVMTAEGRRQNRVRLGQRKTTGIASCRGASAGGHDRLQALAAGTEPPRQPAIRAVRSCVLLPPAPAAPIGRLRLDGQLTSCLTPSSGHRRATRRSAPG